MLLDIAVRASLRHSHIFNRADSFFKPIFHQTLGKDYLALF
jgi:hypothetical protein